MLFRYLIIIVFVLGILPDTISAQTPVVACLDDINDVFPGNKKAQEALDEACKQTKLHTVAGYSSAVQILKGIMDTLPKESVSLMTWKIDLEDAINQADVTPEPAKNEEKLGGCCLPDFHCEYITLRVCDEKKGTWQEGVSCDAIPCTQPAPKTEPEPAPQPEPKPATVPIEPLVVIKTGACVLPDGSCMFLAENVCSTQHGVFKGDGVKCEEKKPEAPVEPTETSKEASPQTIPVPPAPDPAEPQPMWACCPDNPDEECSNTTEANCKNGRWLFGVKCESTNCKGLPGETTEEKSTETELSGTEMERLRKKGENKVEQLKSFIDIISNKSTSTTEAIQAIELAVGLFDSEERTVTVSSLTTGTVKNRKVRVYFNRLMQLPYTEVKVEWANFQYTSKFKKGNDGKYYGYVTFEQRFTGFVDGVPVYQDKVERNLMIVLSKYQKIVNGNSVDEWDVFLGDMAISERK